MESYLLSVHNKDLRIYLTRFRIGELNIMKNVGRRNAIPRVLRSCTFCKDVLEDEFHFIVVCPVYNELRLSE